MKIIIDSVAKHNLGEAMSFEDGIKERMWPKEKMLPQGENGLREKTFPLG
jgi:hypothetical protein